MDKQTILDLVQDQYATIKIPYKSELVEWYGEVSFGYSEWSGKFHVMCSGDNEKRFKDFDEAYEEFSRYFNNIGILQHRLRDKAEDILGEELYLECEEHQKVMMDLIEREQFSIAIEDCSFSHKDWKGCNMCLKQRVDDDDDAKNPKFRGCSYDDCPLRKRK